MYGATVVVGSAVPSSALTNGMQIKDGLSVTSLDPVKLNSASVTVANIPARNGIVHMINTVLIPPSLRNTATTSNTVQNAIESSAVFLSSELIAATATAVFCCATMMIHFL
jgi:Fasciclin domain